MTFAPRFYQTDALESVNPLTEACRKLIVIPTGGGKSYVAGRLASDGALIMGRVLILAHVKELIEQNARAVLQADPSEDIGIVCAGLKRENLPIELQGQIGDKFILGRTDAQITIASVQSVYRKLDRWSDVALIIIDEAHRITPVGGKLYRAVLDAFPNVPVVGLTATPFRTGTGYLHKGEHKLFDEIAYEITLEEVINLGYLVPFANKGSNEAYETEGLKKIGGEYSQKDLDDLTKDGAKTHRIVKQFVQRAADRNHWLIFAINVQHAKMIRQFLRDEGVETGIIYDGMEKEGLSRDDEIDLFKMGIHRALVNVNVLTTGFDFPALDCVVLCRPIASVVLFIQCIGRGTRTSRDTGKTDCLVLDYGGNVSRHGNVSNPEVREVKPGAKTRECDSCGEMNTRAARYCGACNFRFVDQFKECPKCEVIIDKSAQQCLKCGYSYPVNELKLDEEGKTIISNEAVWVDVKKWKAVNTSPFIKAGADPRPNYVLITYVGVDGVTFKEYIFAESMAARPKFARFWVDHHIRPKTDAWDDPDRKAIYMIPASCAETVSRWKELRMPRRVKVIRSGQYYQILHREF